MPQSSLPPTAQLLTSLISSLASLPLPPPPPHPSDQPTPLHDHYPTNPLSLLNLNLASKTPSPSTLSAKNLLTTLHFLFPHELLPALDLLDRKLVNYFITTTTTSSTTSSSSIPNPPQPPSTPYLPASATLPANPAPDVNQSPSASTTDEVFYVQSASAVTGTGTNPKSKRRPPRAYNPAGTHYEVRLRAWNCGCPAFANSVLSCLYGGSQTSDSGGGGAVPDGDGDSHGDCNVDVSGAGDEGEVSAAVGAATPAATVQQFGGSLARESTGTGTSTGNGIPICKHILAAYLGSQVPGLFGQGVVTKRISREEAAGWAGGWGD